MIPPRSELQQQHAAEVGGREGRRQRAVDERAVDHDVDVVEPVAEDRHSRRQREAEDAEHDRRVRHGLADDVVEDGEDDHARPRGAPAKASHLICWRCSPRARRNRTMSDATRADDRDQQQEPREALERVDQRAVHRRTGSSAVDGPPCDRLAAAPQSRSRRRWPPRRSHATGRQRRDSSRPSGKSSRRNVDGEDPARHPGQDPGTTAAVLPSRQPSRDHRHERSLSPPARHCREAQRRPRCPDSSQPIDDCRGAGHRATRTGRPTEKTSPMARSRRDELASDRFRSRSQLKRRRREPERDARTSGRQRRPQAKRRAARDRLERSWSASGARSQSDTCAGWSVSRTTAVQLGVQRPEVDLVAQARRERLERALGVVLAPEEAPVDRMPGCARGPGGTGPRRRASSRRRRGPSRP